MPAEAYGVLTGRAIRARSERTGLSPHFQILLDGGGVQFRAAVNVASNTRSPDASDLLYLLDEDYQHPLLDDLVQHDEGFVALDHQAGGLALDYVRGGLVDPTRMIQIPADLPGADNDLNDALIHQMTRALAEPRSRFHVFGHRWGPEVGDPDEIFRFEPGNGLHNIHMNQGGHGVHYPKNGPWQDGALLIHSPTRDLWTALFLAFQAQSWRTDAAGSPLPEPMLTTSRTIEPDRHPIRISAASIHRVFAGESAGTVSLLNQGRAPFSLKHWEIAGQHNVRQTLDGVIEPGETRVIRLARGFRFTDREGTIRLINPDDREVTSARYSLDHE